LNQLPSTADIVNTPLVNLARLYFQEFYTQIVISQPGLEYASEYVTTRQTRFVPCGSYSGERGRDVITRKSTQ